MATHRPHRRMEHTPPSRVREDSYSSGSGSASHHAAAHASPSPRSDMAMPEAKEDTSLFMAWPGYWLEATMNFWRMFTPMAWLENGRVGERPQMLRSESSQTAREYRYQVPLPGISKEAIELHFRNNAIMLEATDQRGRSLRRAFSLPVYTDGRAIMAHLEDGVLTIVIPKSEKPVAPQERRIPVIEE